MNQKTGAGKNQEQGMVSDDDSASIYSKGEPMTLSRSKHTAAACHPRR
jgi:hypothetical protein